MDGQETTNSENSGSTGSDISSMGNGRNSMLEAEK